MRSENESIPGYFLRHPLRTTCATGHSMINLTGFSLKATGSHQTTAICSLLYLFRLGRRFFNFTRSLRCDVYREHSIASGKPRHVIDFGWMSGCPFLHFKGCQQNGSLTLNFKDWMTTAHFAKGAKNGYSKDCLESV